MNISIGYFRGKGDYFRLGHGSDSHIRKPQVVDGLKCHKVVDVAVGALHCLAVTEQGQVCHAMIFNIGSSDNALLSRFLFA